MDFPILSCLIFSPIVGFIIVLFIPRRMESLIKTVAISCAFVPLLLSGILYLNFNPHHLSPQFTEMYRWIPYFNINYYVGIDGLSLPMVFLTALLTLLSLIISWPIKLRVKEYFSLFLLLETGMLGVFLALDLFLFYVFWELVLVPMYFLVGVWGSERRRYAAIKFVLYTVVGSVFMLVGILSLYFTSQPHTLNILELSNIEFAYDFQLFAWLLFFLGFAIKVPIFPFHTWLPDAHVEAPTAGSVILAGILLKMGVYGFIRISLPILPLASTYFSLLLAVLAAINIIYGACLALAQTDLKRLVAYSSISHMGYCMLGIASSTPVGLNGAVLQMFNHGVITSALFMLVGVIYDRVHTRQIDAFGGLAERMPIYTGVMCIASLAAMGLPGLCGFISEFLCFLGAFPVFRSLTIVSLLGVLISAVYILLMLKKVCFGPLNENLKNLNDMNKKESMALFPLIILIVFVGLFPQCLLELMDPYLTKLADKF